MILIGVLIGVFMGVLMGVLLLADEIVHPAANVSRSTLIGGRA